MHAVLLWAACSPPVSEQGVESVDLLISGGTVVTMDANFTIHDPGFVAVREDRIVALGPLADVSGYSAVRTVDAADTIVLPGLINGHQHAPMTLFRGLGSDLKLMDWLTEYIFPAESKNVDRDFVFWGALLSATEMLESGTTTFVDMYYFEGEVARATSAAGMRGILGQTVIGFPAPDYPSPEETLKGTEQFILDWKDDPLVTPAVDWRQLEFPATTNGIPRFFRADPDHEGMVKDQQVRRLVKLKKNEKTLTMAAAKAGMSRKTARKYLKSGKLPSQCQPERYWRTRSDPFESVWPEVKEILKRSPTVEAKAVFDHLCRQQEGAFQQGQLRTLQRRIKQWKAEYGEAKEVMFPQKYQPGHQAQSDFTFMGRLGVTIQGQPFPHLLYHFVLAYSNWEATTLCFSESFESLSLGLQNALWELGALPEEHRTDRLSAAVKNLKREEFTERYQALLRHFGMRSSRTQAGKAHENGDVEQSHHRLKRAIEQELLLRCSRDFSSREEYEGFVAVIVSRRNAARQKRLGEELAVMRPLPARRLDDFTRQWVRVSPSSTIRVRHNTYSVDSRLIGERVQVRVWADQVEVYYGGRRQARMPRLRGEGKHRIDYRHVIHSLVRKPGAFTRYRWREDLFPGILFRVAYDELRRDCPATADRQYLKILEVAAQEGEQRVREALQVLIERGQRIRFEALRECLVDPVVEPWEVMVEKMDVGLYDTLLENREVRS